MQRIIVHWTGGTNTVSTLDRNHYHFVIAGDGKVVSGMFKPEANLKIVGEEYAAHTLRANTGSIGVSLAGMNGAVESPFLPGKFPINATQWVELVKLCAELCRKYKIAVTPKTLLSHAEVQANLGIVQRGKWDISRLPWDKTVVGAKAVGDKLRREVTAEIQKTAPPPPTPTILPTPPTKPQTLLSAASNWKIEMEKSVILGFVRHMLTFGGGYIAAKGIVDQALVSEAIGALITLIGVGWSFAEKKAR